MPAHRRPDETHDVLRHQSERLYRLERDGEDPSPGSPLREIVFSFYGDLDLSVSPRWSHPDGALLVGVLVQLDTPGSGPTVVQVRRNGTQLLSITVPAGATRAEWLGAGSGVATSDYLQVAVVQAGAGAASLTAQVRFA